MRNRLYSLVLCLCSILLLGGAAIAAEIQDPILKKLVEKGILTPDEATSITQEMEKEKAGKGKEAEEKIEKKVTEAVPEDTKDLSTLVKALKGFKFGGLWYLSYQNGEQGDDKDGKGYSQFVIKRGYFNVEKQFLPWFSGRMTFDVTTVDDPEDEPEDKPNNLNGSIAVRIKYAYGKFNIPEFAFFTKPFVEVGVVHMPWLDFEEHVNWYRCQDTMFLERNDIFNSADIGLTFVSLFGGLIDDEYQKKVNHEYPGRYGSMSLGVYNGGGYHSSEKNQNKAVEGRLTLRPLPDIIPGLQFSYFGIFGKGNQDSAKADPDWRVNLGLVSYEHEYVVLTGQYYDGTGRQRGADKDGNIDENKKDGYSFFAELKPHKKFSIIGRYDFFDPNDDVEDDENSRYIAGIAYHIDKQHKNMVLLDYDHVNYKQANKTDDKRVQLTLQVAF